jgi:hypothetical protein
VIAICLLELSETTVKFIIVLIAIVAKRGPGEALFMEMQPTDSDNCPVSSMDIPTSSDSESECEAPFMGIHSDDDDGDDINVFDTDYDNYFNVHDVIDSEIWGDASIGDVDDDFPGNSVNGTESLPAVDVNVSSHCKSLNILLSRCLVVILAYFWTDFHISDNGMEFLLSGLKKCSEMAVISSQWMAGLAVVFPETLYYFRKGIGLVNDAFIKYVVCPKCHALYEFDKCHRAVGSTRVSNKCTFVKFPNHRQRWRRQWCETVLLKEITLQCGNKKLYPHKIYCYKSMIKSMENLLGKVDFSSHCELWRHSTRFHVFSFNESTPM